MSSPSQSRGAPVAFTRLIASRGCRRPVVTRAELREQGSGRRSVVCVGEALYDLIADQKGLPRDKVKTWTPYAGGAPCNVATSLGKLGLDVTYVTALGRDERGDSLFELIKSSGVDTSAVQRRAEPTRDVYVTLDNEGDREFAGFGLPTEQYADCFIDAASLPQDKLKAGAVLVTGTLGLAYPACAATLKEAARVARAGGCKLLVDVNWRPVFWGDPDAARSEVLQFLQQADIVKVSDADLAWLFGMELDTALLNPCAVADRLPNARCVLVTAGDEGAAYCFSSPAKGTHSGFVPVFKVKTVDTTGAGDAFTAGFIYKLLQAGGLDALAADPRKAKEAVVFAAACGALTTTRPGAIEGQPSLDEVEALYEQSQSWYNFW